MARIRTVKPDFFKHHELYEIEMEHRVPLRLAYQGLWCVADREGRFKWRPMEIKTDVLPYDDINFAEVMDILAAKGFIVKYSVNGKDYGYIPSFLAHQRLRTDEAKSILPAPPEKRESTPISPTTRNDVVTGSPTTLNDSCTGSLQMINESTSWKGKEVERKGSGKEVEEYAHEVFIFSPNVKIEPETPPPVARPPSPNKGPSLEDVKRFFRGAGGTDEMADAFWNKWEGTDWMDGYSKIKNWTNRANNFIANWHRNEKKQTRNGPGRTQTIASSIQGTSAAFADLQRSLDEAVRTGAEDQGDTS